VEKTNRRRFLKYVGGAILAAGSAVALVRTRGYAVPKERADKLKSLSPWHFVVIEHAARRIAAADVPDPGVPTPDEVDVAGFIDAYVARMPPMLRRDLLRLIAYVEHLAPIAAGYGSRFTRLSASEQDRVLAKLEASDESLLRGGFAGLKALVFMGYYRDPRTWKIVGYDGPWVNRPQAGWSP
jgi:hypothetical protein